ncbi:uncharacterized protein BX663DRAFT_462253 [Cokeromyces recurvatus]|uniref:uncharacterized protein n=1 Tax=Cokeromyces recurvatus TaxID=90255 RepID=UPI002220A41D|nr:uncharacterized protein BX663DRAFT_462253 [Cokeromyces recurvatus]KAI7898250.1 hypothetical protein BX663DRAFT_462253 [Cokeromyces recurvatus]
MNYSNNTVYHKKRSHAPSYDDIDIAPSGIIPKKRFISEESFAKDMAAMSLDSSNEYLPQQLIQPYQPTCYQFDNNIDKTELTKNKIRIDDIDQFLCDDEDNSFIDNMEEITTEQKRLIDNGLLLELKPGDKKPRIPDFVLANSSNLIELMDPRDKIAITNILQPNKSKQHIEILNHPKILSYNSMDID